MKIKCNKTSIGTYRYMSTAGRARSCFSSTPSPMKTLNNKKTKNSNKYSCRLQTAHRPM